MHTYDDSQAALKIWGKEDYELWVTVPPDAIPKLAFEVRRHTSRDAKGQPMS